MKALYTGLIVAGLLVVTGCSTSPTGGGKDTNKPGDTGAGGTFTLHGPLNLTDITVKHGTTEMKEVTVKPDKGFQEDIHFEATVDKPGKGVTATVEPKTWKASGGEKIQVKITAADDAAQGEYTVKVFGKPAKGKAVELPLKIKVPEKPK